MYTICYIYSSDRLSNSMSPVRFEDREEASLRQSASSQMLLGEAGRCRQAEELVASACVWEGTYKCNTHTHTHTTLQLLLSFQANLGDSGTWKLFEGSFDHARRTMLLRLTISVKLVRKIVNLIVNLKVIGISIRQ